MEVGYHDFLTDFDFSALDASDAYASDIFIVVDGGDEHLERTLVVALRCGDIFEDCVKETLEVLAALVRNERSGAVTAAAEYHRAVELLVGRVEVHQKFEDFVYDFVDARVWAVDLVDDDDDFVVEFKRLLEDETGLGHRSLGGVDEQKNAVHHLEYALDLTAEVRVAGGVDYVYLDALVVCRRVLREDGYAALALYGVRVHDAVLGRLVLAENTALLEHFVDERGLAMVNVGDYCDVA